MISSLSSCRFCRASQIQSENKRGRKDQQTLGSYQRVEKETRGSKKKKNQDHSDHSTDKICSNTEKSPRDLWRVNVSQKTHLLL